MSDIANASAEQASGIEQVNKALTQMDEVTQQNSALVEENAATAKTLEHQANAMNDRVAAFQIGGADMAQPARGPRPVETARAAVKPQSAAAGKRVAAAKPQPATAPRRAAAGANGAGPVPRMQAAIAAAINHDQDWKEF